jgi:HK97 family phage prohead protease
MNVIRKVTSSSILRSTDDGLFTFACSSELPDRYKDVIVQRGINWKSYLLNNIALLNHDHMSAIGNFINLRLENNQLTADLKLAPEGTSPRIDEIRKLVSAGVLKAVSIGFFGTKTEPIFVNGNRTGTRYLESELCEISLVAVGANREAVAIAKTLGISEGTQQMVFKQDEESPAERLRRIRRSIARVKNVIATTTSATTRNTMMRSLGALERWENEERAALQLPVNRSTSEQSRPVPHSPARIARTQERARNLVGALRAGELDAKRVQTESAARSTAITKQLEAEYLIRKPLEQEALDAEARRLTG